MRAIGYQLELPKNLVERQPFPGPGFAIRIMGGVTKEKLDILRFADHILCVMKYQNVKISPSNILLYLQMSVQWASRATVARMIMLLLFAQ